MRSAAECGGDKRYNIERKRPLSLLPKTDIRINMSRSIRLELVNMTNQARVCLAICRAISNEGLIRLTWRKVEALRQLEQVCDELTGVLGREPTVEEIAQEMQVTTREVCERFVLREQCRVLSLDVPLDTYGEVTVE